ncbi:MAG: ComEC/Rec2 family competence protein [Candidatus Dadabacteria bacterium]|nr:ComEC/Rec2 family competence protein [Candidatus Dadabacteria bacterium]
MTRLSAILNRHLIVVCAVLLVLGVAAGTEAAGVSVYHAAAPGALFVMAAALRFSRLGFALFFPLGLLLPFLHAHSPDPELSRIAGKRAVVSGRLYENAVKRPASVRIPLEVDSVTAGGKTRAADGRVLLYSDGHAGLAYGDRITAKVRLRPVKGFKNPGAGGYEERLAARGVFFTAYAGEGDIKTGGRDENSNPLLRAVGELRGDYAAFIRKNLGPTAAEIVNSLSIGDKGALPDEVRRNFSALGIGHLLAISGLHVGVAAVFFYMTLKWLLKRSQYLMLTLVIPRIAAAATIPAALFYALLTGLSNSSTRAAIMAAVYLTAMIIGRRDDRLNALAAAAIIILIASPAALFEASFILSFSAVLGILLALNRFGAGGGEKDSPAWRKAGRAVAAILFTTAAATAATLPFVINMFGFVPVLTFPANLVAMPLALAMVPLCIVSVAVFAATGFVPGFLLDTLGIFSSALTGAADILAGADPAVTAPVMSGRTFIVFYLCAAAVLAASRSRKPSIYAAAALSLLLAASAAYDLRPAHGKHTEAVFFDAGRKKTALFIFADGKTVLIKGGFSKKARSDFIERAVILPALRAKRVTKTDTLILLSNDRGHLNGAAALIEGGDVENLWINSPKLNSRLWETIEKHGVLWRKIYHSPPDRHAVKFLQLHEQMGIADSSAPYPVLVRVSYGETSFLLMESIHNTRGKNVEKVYKNELKSDVVFLPDTNNKNRSAVLAVARAAEAGVVVCGKCRAEIEREGMNARVYETDTGGMVSVFTDGRRITKTETFARDR